MRTVTLIDAIKEAYQEELRRDDSVFLVGQDIRGAIFPHTKGLVEEFGPERIVDTPIAESGMYGVAFGAAQEGMRPICDFMFGGFSYVTFSECSVTTGQYHFLDRAICNFTSLSNGFFHTCTSAFPSRQWNGTETAEIIATILYLQKTSSTIRK